MRDKGGPGVRSLLHAALLVLFFLTLVRNAWMGDDAYITLRTVDNFVRGHGLTWNVAERVQSYTHPLWMFLLSGLYVFTHEGYFTTILPSIVLSFAAVLLLLRGVALQLAGGVAALAALLLSRSFMDYTTSGLETPLSYLLCSIFFFIFFNRRATTRWLFSLCLVASLAALNRMDNLLLYLPALALAAALTRRVKIWAWASLGFLPLLCWMAFSFFYYGFVFPNTYYAKLHTGVRKLHLIEQGICYFVSTLSDDAITVIVLVLGVTAALLRRRLSHMAVAGGILLYSLYILWIGGDFMRGRLLVLPFLMAVILIARFPLPRLDDRWTVALVLLVVATGLFSKDAPIFGDVDYFRKKTWDEKGISDERGYWYRSTGLLRITRDLKMPMDRKRHEGKAARDKGEAVIQKYGVGIFGFFAGPKVHIVDFLGLCDPLMARLEILDTEKWRIGHFKRVRPNGYMETLKSKTNHILDPGLAQYYDRLAFVTRGELWSWKRIETAVKLNLGRYDHLLPRHSYEDGPVQRLKLSRVPHKDARGKKWDDEGVLVLFRRGLEVDLEGIRHQPLVEASLDAGGDVYVLQLLRGKKELWHKVLPTERKVRNLATFEVEVPQQVARRGYDRIKVLPLKNDGMTSLGHLRLLHRAPGSGGKADKPKAPPRAAGSNKAPLTIPSIEIQKQ